MEKKLFFANCNGNEKLNEYLSNEENLIPNHEEGATSKLVPEKVTKIVEAIFHTKREGVYINASACYATPYRQADNNWYETPLTGVHQLEAIHKLVSDHPEVYVTVEIENVDEYNKDRTGAVRFVHQNLFYCSYKNGKVGWGFCLEYL